MSGILIADAGSTKTHWTFLKEGKEASVRFSSEGLNPLHDTKSAIISKLQFVKDSIGDIHPEEIHFFGAGCAIPEVNEILKFWLGRIFNLNIVGDNVTVESDLKGAAIALFGDGEGIACILGTGSNSAYFSNGKFLNQVPSLGFILGDEGGGVDLGKRLLNAIFKKQLPKDICESFFNKYSLSLSELLSRVYSEPKPAPFIASFSPFIAEHIERPEISGLVEQQFNLFFERNIIPYGDITDLPVGFVGSVAYSYAEILKKSALNYGVTVSDIIEAPMFSLERYYSTK
ncbi:MAG: ATPase [Muribaculaceae bacterium]|nr:ATPase [Muribaculaceae bacterium]